MGGVLQFRAVIRPPPPPLGLGGRSPMPWFSQVDRPWGGDSVGPWFKSLSVLTCFFAFVGVFLLFFLSKKTARNRV